MQGSFLDLQVGDRVVFELLADAISGPRAQNVRLAPARKSALAVSAYFHGTSRSTGLPLTSVAVNRTSFGLLSLALNEVPSLLDS